MALSNAGPAEGGQLGGSPPGTYVGVIEGFSGPPWPQPARRAMLRWIAAHGLNTYVYAPVGDPFQRERWREQYPPRLARKLGELAAVSRQQRVRMLYAVAPSAMCYSSATERDTLVAKLEQVRALGVRDVMLEFDDIVGGFACSADSATFGEGDAALGAAHAAVANDVLARLRRTSRGTRLIVVPFEYSFVEATPYLEAFAASLAPGADVAFTGRFVVPSTIDVSDVKKMTEILGRRPVLWENYPVNDYAPGALHLGPLAGRDPDLPRHLAGYLANPTNQPTWSRIPLLTFAEYLRLGSAYDPARAWRAAVRELAAGQRAAQHVRRFAELTQSITTLDDHEPIWSKEAPGRARRLARLTRSLVTGAWPQPLKALRDRFALEARLPAALARTLGPRSRAVREARPWLARLRDEARAARRALGAIEATQPAITSTRVRKRADGGYVVSGRVAAPSEAVISSRLRRARLVWDRASGSAASIPSVALPFLLGIGHARSACAGGPLTLALDGRNIRVLNGGRFEARLDEPGGVLTVAAGRSQRTVRTFGAARPPSDGAARRRLRSLRQQLGSVFAELEGAIVQRDVAAVATLVSPRYESASGVTADDLLSRWTRLLQRTKLIRGASFSVVEADFGGQACGGPVVAAVEWSLAGVLHSGVFPGGLPFTFESRSAFLLENSGSRRNPAWRIVGGFADAPDGQRVTDLVGP